MNLKTRRMETLKTAALLHDIGKIGINDNILNKPARLTDEEMDEVMKHPEIGISILSNMHFLSEVREIILKHHEKYDSSGYPAHLNKDEIPIEAYILSVADAYDAMTTDRSYRKGMAREKAMEIIQKDSGTHFHPRVAEAFIKVLKEEIREENRASDAREKLEERSIFQNTNA
jgi:putative nucleotidyltransferase with HDIG domain